MMRILLAIMLATIITSACAEKPRSPYNPPDVQRAHADQAKDELSSKIEASKDEKK